ncbi:hypothetical protein [Kitasatospora sp. NPDC059327]|uniref:hypothetical protein n=1 Tax=Kitasatospora sp. NPDC059327 TaxID=3346803 RepID=UPI0036A52251
MTTDDLTTVFRRAIETANDDYNRLEHAKDHRFELEISRGWWDDTTASRYVDNALHQLLLERDPALRSADVETVRAAKMALRADLAPEMTRYLAYCRSGTFTGWSHAGAEDGHPVIHRTTEERLWTAPAGQRDQRDLERAHPANRARPGRR